MDLSRWWIAIVDWTKEHETIVEGIVLLLGFAESLLFISFVIPASALFIAIAAVEGAAGGALLPLVLAGTIGAFAGDMVSFALGVRFQNDLDRRWPFRTNPAWIPRTKSLFERWGTLAVVVSKFVGPLRPVVPLVAGAAHMPIARFAIASSTSCLIWAGAFLAPAYYGMQLLGSNG